MGILGYLLDTHTLLWVVRGSDRLSANAKKVLSDPNAQHFISAVSAYEIMYKHNLGRLSGYEDIAENYIKVMQETGADELPITVRHAHYAGQIQWNHRDPFDRLLVAQACINNLTLITDDTNIKSLSWVNTLW